MEAAPAERRAELQNRILRAQAKTTELEAKTFDQVFTEDPRHVLAEFGKISPSDTKAQKDWFSRNVAWLSNPVLAPMYQNLQKQSTTTQQALIETAQFEASAKEAMSAAQVGFNVSIPADKLAWRRKQANEIARQHAKDAQKLYDPSKLSEGWFDPETGRVDDTKLDQSVFEMPRSEMLQSRDEFYENKLSEMRLQGDIRERIAQIRLEAAQGKAPPAKIQEAEMLNDLRVRAEAETDPVKRKQLNDELAFKAGIISPGEEISVNSQTGEVSIRRGGMTQKAGLTQTVQTQLQQQMIQGESVFEKAQMLLPKLNPGTVGVRGFANRVIVDSVIAQFTGQKIGEAIEADALAMQFQAPIVKLLRSDSNITKDERESIVSTLPQPKDWIGSSQGAKLKLSVALESAARASRSGAKMLGKPIPIHYLLPEEIKAMLDSGQITADQARSIASENAWLTIAKIKSEVQR